MFIEEEDEELISVHQEKNESIRTWTRLGNGKRKEKHACGLDVYGVVCSGRGWPGVSTGEKRALCDMRLLSVRSRWDGDAEDKQAVPSRLIQLMSSLHFCSSICNVPMYRASFCSAMLSSDIQQQQQRSIHSCSSDAAMVVM